MVEVGDPTADARKTDPETRETVPPVIMEEARVPEEPAVIVVPPKPATPLPQHPPAPARIVAPPPKPQKPAEPEFDWRDEVIAVAPADGPFFDMFMRKLWPTKFTAGVKTPITAGSQLVLRHRLPKSRQYVSVDELERAGFKVPPELLKRFRDEDALDKQP